MPDFLYHYTTLESLAMILKSKSIKFNPLTVMDDPQEQLTQDVINLGKYVFISSWIDEERESIAMWKMYSNLESGVRIKLRCNPFKKYVLTKEEISEFFPGIAVSGETMETVIPIHEYANGKYHLANCGYDKIVERVQYSDDISKLTPKIIEQDKNGIVLRLGELGKYKNKYWEFQNEVRYILRFLPVGLKESVMLGDKIAQVVYDKIYNPYGFELKNYILSLDDNAYSEMEITTAPCFSAGNNVMLKALQEKYNEKMIINESKLKEYIR